MPTSNHSSMLIVKLVGWLLLKSGMPSARVDQVARRMQRFIQRWDKYLFFFVLVLSLLGGVTLLVATSEEKPARKAVLRPEGARTVTRPAPPQETPAPEKPKGAVVDLDLNGDGHLEKAELIKGLPHFDLNGNGRVDPEEVSTAKQAVAKTVERRRHRTEDSNGDGQVDMDELYQQMRKSDRDQDGTLSIEEQKAYFRQFDLTVEQGTFAELKRRKP